MKNPEKVKQGKKSRKEGKAFEVKVRKDLTEKGWIVNRFDNNVEFVRTPNEKGEQLIIPEETKLITAKGKFNPFTKRVMNMSGGFPDFVSYKLYDEEENFYDTGAIPKKPIKMYEVIGVECKMTGKLDKEEKEKCQWLLDNHVFSKILIARKGEKRGEIIYEEFKSLSL